MTEGTTRWDSAPKKATNESGVTSKAEVQAPGANNLRGVYPATGCVCGTARERHNARKAASDAWFKADQKGWFEFHAPPRLLVPTLAQIDATYKEGMAEGAEKKRKQAERAAKQKEQREAARAQIKVVVEEAAAIARARLVAPRSGLVSPVDESSVEATLETSGFKTSKTHSGLEIWLDPALVPAPRPGYVPGAIEKAIRERLVEKKALADRAALENASARAPRAVSWYMKRDADQALTTSTETLRTGEAPAGLEIWLDPVIVPVPRPGYVPGAVEKAIRARLIVKKAEFERSRARVDALLKLRNTSKTPRAFLSVRRHRDQPYAAKKTAQEIQDERRRLKAIEDAKRYCCCVPFYPDPGQPPRAKPGHRVYLVTGTTSANAQYKNVPAATVKGYSSWSLLKAPGLRDVTVESTTTPLVHRSHILSTALIANWPFISGVICEAFLFQFSPPCLWESQTSRAYGRRSISVVVSIVIRLTVVPWCIFCLFVTHCRTDNTRPGNPKVDGIASPLVIFAPGFPDHHSLPVGNIAREDCSQGRSAALSAGPSLTDGVCFVEGFVVDESSQEGARRRRWIVEEHAARAQLLWVQKELRTDSCLWEEWEDEDN
ncbi:hypothetical protein C8F04DRAFT_1188049 [Mycena alexandri]|uniref:Uncharacterized protein n=1 Tax=Mycena alexandri TaxID=1745969 RepID=A0AAD6SKD2_9AGAR|nr:hypothetical protein C8F04DRAFT_1188049 [Mycena alexandri]